MVSEIAAAARGKTTKQKYPYMLIRRGPLRMPVQFLLDDDTLSDIKIEHLQ